MYIHVWAHSASSELQMYVNVKKIICVTFRNLLAGIWGSFLRFIETEIRNWLAACREPALTQKVSLRLKPY